MHVLYCTYRTGVAHSSLTFIPYDEIASPGTRAYCSGMFCFESKSFCSFFSIAAAAS